MTKSRVERGAHKNCWLDIGSGPQREHFEARCIDVRPSGADFTVLGVKVCAPSRSALVDVGTSSAVFAFAWIAITSEKAMTRTPFWRAPCHELRLRGFKMIEAPDAPGVINGPCSFFSAVPDITDPMHRRMYEWIRDSITRRIAHTHDSAS